MWKKDQFLEKKIRKSIVSLFFAMFLQYIRCLLSDKCVKCRKIHYVIRNGQEQVNL